MYRYRTARDHFAYTGPQPKCDCDLLQTEYCCQREDLVHTRLVDAEQFDFNLDEGRQRLTCRVEIRQCPTCQQLWWMHLRDDTHHTYERDSMPPVVIGSVAVTFSSAVRCPDRGSADELTQWLPRHLDALARCQRMDRAHRGNLIGAVRACVELAALNPRTALLAENAGLPRTSNDTRSSHDARLRTCIDILEKTPDDAAAWQELKTLQGWCQQARLLDPAAKPEHWTAQELWTPALAGVDKLEFQIWGARNAAQGKPLGSPEHRELRRIEDAIATAWTAHMRTMEWPSPEIELHCLVEHAALLRPETVKGDTASWEHPRQVCMRIYQLLSQQGVVPSWRVTVSDWVAERTGLPDGAKRTHENACRRALLDKRRRERQRLEG